MSNPQGELIGPNTMAGVGAADPAAVSAPDQRMGEATTIVIGMAALILALAMGSNR